MKNLDLYLVTFNCAKTIIQPDVFGSYLFEALPQPRRSDLPDVLVLSLEEVAPISYSFLGGSFLTPYYNAFRKAVKVASGNTTYVNVAARNVGMTAIMLFVKKDIASTVAYIHSAGVGVGLQEMGNKGAVAIRIGLRAGEGSADIMETTFVAAHLAAMEDGLQRRNEDWRNIVRRLVFVEDQQGEVAQRDEQSEEAPLLQGDGSGTPTIESEMFSPRSHLFIAGDLNYRTSASKPGPYDYQQFPKPQVQPGDLLHYSTFLPRDQLTEERLGGRTLHGLIEAPIGFPPTYKYSPKTSIPVQTDDVESWEWAQHRWPSWCDRILYLDIPKWMKQQHPERSIEVHEYNALPLFSTSDHRPVALSLTIPWMAIPREPANPEDIRYFPPFDIDPHWNMKRSVARKKELLVGLFAYLGLTWEGNGLLAATIIGAVGGYLIIKSLLTT